MPISPDLWASIYRVGSSGPTAAQDLKVHARYASVFGMGKPNYASGRAVFAPED